MKKDPNSVTLTWRAIDNGGNRSPKLGTNLPRTQLDNVRKAVLPRSLEVMFALRYRR